MLMIICNTIGFLALFIGIAMAAFIFGFYYGIDYANLDEKEVEEMKYDKNQMRLARLGSWILEHTHM